MIDLQGLDAIGFTQQQAFTVVHNRTDENGINSLFKWIDFQNKTGFTVDQQEAAARDIFLRIDAMGNLENCGGNLALAQEFGVPLSWVEQITDAIFNVVEQIKNGAVPTETP